MTKTAHAIALAFMWMSSPAQARPASLDIVADCGATPDDATDDTLAIRSCIAQTPFELTIPVGVFLVDRTLSNQAAALEITTSDTVVRGAGAASVIQLIRPSNGVTGTRVFGVTATTADIARVTFRDFTIDGGRTLTCLEAKHTPGTSDGAGQQQHGLFLSGQGAAVSFVRVQGMQFTRLSGDSIYGYQGVHDFTLEGQSVGGYCRAGIALNAYASPAGTTCDDAGAEGMRRVLVKNNIFTADATATQGARGIDIEPNAPVCDVTVEGNTTDEIEVGQTIRVRVVNNTITDVGAQLAGSIALVSSQDFEVSGNTVRGFDVVTPPLYVRKSHRGTVKGNRVYQPYPVEGIAVSNNGSSPSSDIVVEGNRVEYTGATVANAYAIRTQGVEGSLTITTNTIVGLWNHGVYVFGAGDALIADNIWAVEQNGIVARSSGTGMLKTTVLTVEGNRGTAPQSLLLTSGAIDTIRECGNASTGGVSIGSNTLTPCSPSTQATQATLTDHEARIEALEATP